MSYICDITQTEESQKILVTLDFYIHRAPTDAKAISWTRFRTLKGAVKDSRR